MRRPIAVPRWLIATLEIAGVAVAIALLVLWLTGAFAAKVEPSTTVSTLQPQPGAETLVVGIERVPVFEPALGTIEAIERVEVGSRLMARVRTVHVRAGQPVEEGDLLVELEKSDLEARLDDARAARRAAEAALGQAEIDLARVQQLFDQNIAPKSRLDQHQTAVVQREADVQRAGEAITEAETILDYATIRAPSSGIVIERHVEPGNLATPGQVVVTLYDPTRLQLVATVREQIAIDLELDQVVRVRIDAIDKTCEARIAEIVPEAETQSRSFSVKVTGPCPPNVYSGMFGRLLLPVGEREEIRIPDTAIRTFGQVEVVFVVLVDGSVLRRFVTTGRRAGGRVEVLSGLQPGETIVVDAERFSRG